MTAPTVLLYNLDSEKGRRIKLLCLAMKLRVRNVSPAEYGIPLKQLLQGGGEKASSESTGFSEEMLVLAHLSNGQLDDFLRGFRRKKIAPVALKAVLTPSNSAWDSLTLRQELLREREAIEKQSAAQAFKNESPAGNS